MDNKYSTFGELKDSYKAGILKGEPGNWLIYTWSESSKSPIISSWEEFLAQIRFDEERLLRIGKILWNDEV